MSPEGMESLIARFQARRPVFIDRYLQSEGLSSWELTARHEQIPEPIRKALPDGWGFGLSGTYGAGKTFAVASLIRNHAEEAVSKHMDAMLKTPDRYEIESALRDGRLHLTCRFTWINWPEASTRARARLFGSREDQQEVEPWIEETLLDYGRILVLDDIGTDRPTAQDWVGDLLGRVIDERLRWSGPLVWTSNLTEAGLIERYGPRTFSRLQALAPVIQLPKLPDLRLQRGPAAGQRDSGKLAVQSEVREKGQIVK